MLGSTVTDEDIQEFRDQLSGSFEVRRHIRIIGVGQEGVGKTTLCRRLLRQDFKNVTKTRSIETHIYSAVITETEKADCDLTVQNIKGKMRKYSLTYTFYIVINPYAAPKQYQTCYLY